MKKIIVIICLLFASVAQADGIVDWLKTRAYFGVGEATYEMPPNGQYYQLHSLDNIPHNFNLKTTAWAVGLSGHSDWLPRNTKWRFEYLNLGTVRSVAKGTSDTNYDAVNQTCVVQPCDVAGHFSTWSVEAENRGFVTALAPEWPAFGGKVFGEVGIYWGLPKINVRIDRPNGSTDYYSYKGGLNAGGVIGGGFQYGKASIVVRYIHVDAVNRNKDVYEEDIPPNHGTRVLSVMARWSIQ